jgi:hypothetical protein
MMPAVVDLDRVRRARAGLRALAVDHPELTDPAARRRFAAWLAEEARGERTMPKPKLPDEERLMVTLGLRLTAEEAARLDAIVERIPIASRHSIARAALRIGLEALEDDPTRIVAPARKPRRPARR